MKKSYNIYLLLILTALFTACQSDENLPVQYPDGYNEIRFSINTEKEQTSRVSSGYRTWDGNKDPATMGIYGFYSLNATNFSSCRIFDNISFTHSDESGTIWQVTNDADKKYWPDYTSFSSFDFVGYMPHQESNVNITYSSTNNYTLSFSVAGKAAVITDTKQLPLISRIPVHTNVTGGTINDMEFDQTYTGFKLQFKLGEKMDQVRDFTIKSVKIKGAASMFYSGGKISRTYTWNASSWSANAITWSDKTAASADADFSVPYADGTAQGYDNTNKTLLLNSSSYLQWGSNFYVIPSTASAFTPTIEVVYDVTTNPTEQSVLTRKEVTSTIVLNGTNFKDYKDNVDDKPVHLPGKVHPIQILIVPSYLYVLADADQHAGIIVVPTSK